MPGVHFSFSKSVPAGKVAGRTPGWAPTRTSSTFSPAHFRAFVRSKTPAEKQPAYSPTFVPFTQTAVPNWALLTRSVATALRAGAVNVLRYQK
jgi:hypothetical protein